MEFKGLTLDKFQEDAIKAIDNNHSVIVSAPTGSGKTLIADYIIKVSLEKGIKVIYTAPIKALSNQKYKEFSSQFGEKNIGLLTGDISINPSAPVLIMTTEIYRNMVLTNDESLKDISYVIFDEIHFINDIERGTVWEESIIFSKENIRFLGLSATIPNAQEFADWIHTIKKHPVDVIINTRRPVPLHKKFYDTELGITTLEEIKEVNDIPGYKHVMGRSRRRRPMIKAPYHADLVRSIRDKVPCFFFCFSRQRCEKYALELARKNIFPSNPQISAAVRKKITNPNIANLDSTKMLRQTLPYGIGFHHAGLIPQIKELVEELFSSGLINVLYTTETFAVGINMPAKAVCFDSLRKFDGINFRSLNSKEFFQIAGRAGRRGIDKEGFVYVMIDRRDFDYPYLSDMTSSDKEPIRSQFKLSVNTVLNLIKQHTNEEIRIILCMNFFTYQKYGKNLSKQSSIISNFLNIKKKLAKLGYLANDKLTEKGEFSSRIYSDEILTGQLFATEFYKSLNEYQMLMVIGCLAYEAKEKVVFYEKFESDLIFKLKHHLRKYNIHDKRFYYLERLTSLIYPCYNGKTIFDVINNTNLLEGDIIRFFRQIVDRIRQIRDATTDRRLKDMLSNCQKAIDDSMCEIDIV